MTGSAAQRFQARDFDGRPLDVFVHWGDDEASFVVAGQAPVLFSRAEAERLAWLLARDAAALAAETARTVSSPDSPHSDQTRDADWWRRLAANWQADWDATCEASVWVNWCINQRIDLSKAGRETITPYCQALHADDDAPARGHRIARLERWMEHIRPMDEPPARSVGPPFGAAG